MYDVALSNKLEMYALNYTPLRKFKQKDRLKFDLNIQHPGLKGKSNSSSVFARSIKR